MKSSIIAGSLMATFALANPVLEKKFLVYTTDIITVTATATGWSWGWGNHDGWSTETAVASSTPAPVSTQAPAPTTTAVAWTSDSSWSSAAAPSSSAAPASDYAQAILDQHNNHRQNSSAPSLTWSDDMASIASEIAASCTYAHNTQAGGGGYGQNIGAGSPPDSVPALITNEMYNAEIGWYPLPYGSNSPDMTNFEHWGHYSQIVWKSTTSVGCATQYCPNGLAGTTGDVAPYFTVCNYSPPGNYGGEYSNVGAPDGGLATVQLSS